MPTAGWQGTTASMRCADLLEIAGDFAAARSGYRTAARRITSLPKRLYLEAHAARLTDDRQDPATPVEIDHLALHERRAT
jgi:hypothetical protein